MALHLNLNHELERVRAERRRDPLKLTMLGLILVAALFAVQYMWNMTKTALVTRERDAKRADFAAKEPLAKAAAIEEAELQKKLGNSERFQARIESKFHWAPLIQLLMENIPGNIHITRFAGDVNNDDSSKVQFKLEGLIVGPAPLTLADDFRQKLGQALEKKYRNVNTSYRHLLEEKEPVQIEGKSLANATFTINVQMQHRESTAAAK
jgi:hypothetical protein